MATPLTLHWTPIAIGHLRATYEYVAQDNEKAADSVIERILSAAEMLSQYPQLGRAGRAPNTRELVIAGTPFVVVYSLKRTQVRILAVFHTARRWPEVF